MVKKIRKVIAAIIGISGVAVLSVVIVPIMSYEAISQSEFATYLSPIPENQSLGIFDTTTADSTNASTWFAGGAKPSDFNSGSINFYTISIPKLGIKNATVAIGGEDLKENLIQYPGTALPGKYGNTVIFGHSVLPMFFNSQNYMTIFSTLYKLKKGDNIEIYYDGIRYSYIIESLVEVYPTNLEVLDQGQSDSYVSLITCTPPGDPRKPKRLVVRARIIPPGVNIDNDTRN